MHGDRGRLADVIEDAGVGHLLDEVQDVVEAADEGVDVLAVERRDEGRLELVPDVVADLVAAVLELAELDGDSLALAVASEEGLEEPRAGQNVRRVVDEHVVELLLARYQGNAHEVLVPSGAGSCACGFAPPRRSGGS